MDYWTILEASLPVYLVIAAGLVLRRIKLFPEELDAGTMRLIINFLFPCFILDKILGNEALDHLGTITSAAASGFLLILLGFGLSYLAALAVGMRRTDGLRTFSLATGIQNYGFIPIPIIAKLFASKATMGVLFMHSLGVELALWTVGVAILTGFGKAPWKHLFNAPIIAILLGLAINASGIYPKIPDSATTTIAMLASCSIPLSLLLVGSAISDLISVEVGCAPSAARSPPASFASPSSLRLHRLRQIPPHRPRAKARPRRAGSHALRALPDRPRPPLRRPHRNRCSSNPRNQPHLDLHHPGRHRHRHEGAGDLLAERAVIAHTPSTPI